jgi:dTDP-4-dehydrorhamnose reductase
MRIVVTGVHGQVSSALAARCAALDCDFMALGRPAMDLALLSSIEPAIRAAEPDIIVSAGAYTAVDKAEREPKAAFLVNCDGVSELGKVARSLSVPIIHLSTDYVFDGESESPHIETDETNPINTYGKSKLAGENVLRATTDRYVILRTSWVYSQYGHNFVKTMLRLAKDRDAVSVVDDQIGSPTSADDIARAILILAKNLTRDDVLSEMYGTFHLCGGGRTSWAGFAEEIFRISRACGGPSARVKGISSAEFSTMALRPKNSCLCTDRIEKLHGIALPDWRQSLAIVVPQILRAQ